MEKHLQQDEIDSMFAQAREAAGKEQATPADTVKREPYNFSRAGQISNEQMQAISTVNDLFARNLTHNLGAWLRTKFEVTLASAEQMMYSEFTERIPEPAYVCSARLEPLDVMGAVQMDLSMAPPIVDLLLGGVGRAGPLREPTDIEEAILFSVMGIVMRELNLAWQPVGLKFALDKRELEAQVLRLMPGTEKILCVSFEVRMPETQGSINLCLPSVVLNTILRRLIAERDRPRRRSMEARERLSALMAEAEFGVSLQFPPMRLNAGELSSLAPGKVLRLPLQRQSAAELRVGGLPVFRALPIRTGERRGAQVKGHTLHVGEFNVAVDVDWRIANHRQVKGLNMDANANEAAANSQTAAVSARDLLMEIELDATLQFGSRELPLKDVLALSSGDVLELDRQVNEPVELVVGNRIIARGEVVIVDGNFALLVTEVAEPQLRLESIRGLF